MASEELFLGETGTGPGSDLASATQVAALMVGALGMGGSLVSFEAVAEGVISRTNLVGRVISDRDGKQRVEDLLQAQKERIAGLLAANRDLVDALRDALIARDELVGEEIVAVIHEALARREQPGSAETPSQPLAVIDLTNGTEAAASPQDA
jgi:ATP-dependent Zn protease